MYPQFLAWGDMHPLLHLLRQGFSKFRFFSANRILFRERLLLNSRNTAEKIFGTFSDSLSYLKMPEKFIHSGNPIRNNVLVQTPKNEAKKAFHLEHCDKVILVIGGSQGAVKLNDLVLGLEKSLSP